MIFQVYGRDNALKTFEHATEHDLNGTWKYHPGAQMPEGTKYATIYGYGKSVEDLCPRSLASKWEELSSLMSAHHNAIVQAKICLKKNNFFSLLPGGFARDFMTIKNQITEHVLTNYSEPKNYNFLASVHEMLEEISYQEVKINTSVLSCKRI